MKIPLIIGILLCLSGLIPGHAQKIDIAVTASSTLPPGSTSNYSPDNLIDGTEASWSEGAKGSGVGEYISVDFRYPDQLKYVMLKNGFGKKKYWESNGRIKRMKISDENGVSRTIELCDSPDMKVYGLLDLTEDENGTLWPSEPLSGSSYTFEILEVYPGEKWEDACITEMDFNHWWQKDIVMRDEYIFKNLFRTYFDGVFDRKGDLYIDSDWDGLVKIDVDDGYHYGEIRSGDGTEGHEEYQVFINYLTGDYYLFTSTIISQVDYERFDSTEEAQEVPAMVDSFRWQCMVYDPSELKFTVKNSASFDDLFDVNPLKALSTLSGKDLDADDIWIICDERGYLKFVYPPGFNYYEAEAFYMWDGNWFRLQKD